MPVASPLLLANGQIQAGPPPTKIGRFQPTAVFDAYWTFAAERQRIFFRRLLGNPPPWTSDPVLRANRFTNAYRASDRVSQFLISHVIPNSEPHANDIFFRVMLFKLFNRINTWRLLETTLGDLHEGTFDVVVYNRVLSAAFLGGHRLYSAAYIMPAPKLGAARKHTNHLLLLKLMLAHELPERISRAPRMEAAYHLLVSYPSIGPFLAFQFLTDLNYSTLTSFDEMEFVVAGPGAVDGIRKCFTDTGGLSDSGVIRAVAEMAEAQFEQRGLDFPHLWGRALQLIDCQNLFCEIDKYARVAHPSIVGRTGRQRIKRRYREVNPEPFACGYPPKWGLPRSEVAIDGRKVPYPPAAVPARK